ncbi:MAG: YbfB/YjiJ family MFS transporter [Actinomyces sp.]|nr:MAG: YbfB/YjiJ family MFS transporter [Actinomyces sp.]
MGPTGRVCHHPGVPEPVAPRPVTGRAVLTVALVMATALVAQAFGRFSWGVVLPDARDDILGGSNTLAGLLGTLNVTAYLAGTFAVSWAASRLSLVGLVRVGLVASTTGLALASVTRNPAVLGAALVLMGLGGAAIWIPAPALSARELPPWRRGLAVGLVGAGIGIGLVFAGQLAALLRRRTDADDVWQLVYRVEFGVALAVLVASFVWLRSAGDRPAAAGGVGGFGALRTVAGWIPAVVAYAAFGFSYLLVIGFLVARLEDDAGFSSAEASAMFSLVGAATIVGGVGLGAVSDRIGRRVTLTAAFTVFGACALLLLTGRQPWVAVASVGAGLMFSGMPALIIAHLVEHTDVDTYGPAFSAATLAFGVAQMISPQVGGAMADALGSFTWVFVLSALVAGAGAVASSRLPPPLVGHRVVVGSDAEA